MFENLLKFADKASESLSFLLVVVLTAICIVAIAYIGERVAYKISGQKRQNLKKTMTITVCGMLSAIAAVLMLWELPVWFAPPSMYKMDFSDIPAMIAGIAFGPVASVVVEFVKILLKVMVVKPTSTAFVGEYANFVVGCALVVPASIIFQCRRNIKSFLLGGIAGTVLMSTLGTALNAIYFIPKLAAMFHMPVSAVVDMGTKINSHITSLTDFVFLAVAPLNILKGSVCVLFVVLCYRGIMAAVRTVWVREAQ